MTAETNGNSAGASGAANIKYQFSVIDPTAEYVQVNITADIVGSAVSTVTSGAEGVYNNAYASAYSDVSYSAYSNTPLGVAYGMVVASATTGGKVSSATQNQSLNASFYVLVNSAASVNVYSWCDDSSFGGTSACNAYVDPIVQITPAFLAGNPEAKLIFSSGIHQVNGVPEPSTWAMLIVGFGGLGYAGWRRGRGAGRRSDRVESRRVRRASLFSRSAAAQAPRSLLRGRRRAFLAGRDHAARDRGARVGLQPGEDQH